MHLPDGMAQQRKAQKSVNLNLMGFRMAMAKELHMMLIFRQGVDDDEGEEWRGVSSASPDLIAETAVAHADALMKALGFEVQVTNG